MENVMRILLVEDSPGDAELIKRELKKNGKSWEVRWVDAKAPFLSELEAYRPDAVLCDYKMPGFGAAEALEIIQKQGRDIPFIVVSGAIGEDVAVEMVKSGATDYILKDKMHRLSVAVERSFEEVRERAERKKAEQNLRQTEEQFRRLIENSHDIIYTLNVQGVFTFVSPAWTTLLGHPVSDVVGKPFQHFVHPDDIGTCEEFLRKALATGQAQTNIEYRVRHSDGSWRWHTSNAVPLKDNAGRIVSGEGIASDITERKKAERDLQEAKAVVDAIVENVPLMIFLKETERLRFVMFNRAGEELLGYDRKDLIGKSDSDFFPPEQAAHFIALDRKALACEGGVVDIPEEPIRTAKQGQRLLHTRKVCIQGADGATKFLLGISEDITDRKRMEQSLQKELESLQSFMKLAVGRELKMIELKNEIARLKQKLSE